jgi:hypothetical protein
VDCNKLIPRGNLAYHQAEVCMVPCALFCGVSVTRRLQQMHEDVACLNAEVACQFASAGCAIRVRRRNLNDHLKGEALEHSLLLLASFQVCQSSVVSKYVVLI